MSTTEERTATDSPSNSVTCSGAMACEYLNLLAKDYKHNGDQMTCRCCRRSIVVSRWNEQMIHERECRNAGEVNPWKMLAEVIHILKIEGIAPRHNIVDELNERIFDLESRLECLIHGGP